MNKEESVRKLATAMAPRHCQECGSVLTIKEEEMGYKLCNACIHSIVASDRGDE